jgi:hypothetical protein
MQLIGQYLSPSTLAGLDAMRTRFAAAKPFRHVVIDNFLRAEVAERLLTDFPSHPDPSCLVNEFGAPNPKNAVPDVRSIGPFYREFDDFVASASFRDAIGRVVSIEELEYDPYYFGAGTHENFHDAGLDAHYDFNIHPRTGTHRRLNVIIYLNKDWDPRWGGQICLHTNPYNVRGDQVTEIEAAFNRCIIFETTETSWHSVSLVNLPEDKRHLSRKSFTIYMYTRTRPAEEAAPSHGTVYVQEGLHPAIVPGHMLTEADVERLVANFERRNSYLQNLYAREYHFSGVIENLKQELRATQARTAVPLLGMARLVTCATPLFADGWMGRGLDIEVDLLEPSSELVFVGWRPEHMPHSIEVMLEAGARTASAMMDGQRIELRVPFTEPVSGRLRIRVDVPQARRHAEDDLRELSMIVDRLQFSPSLGPVAVPAEAALARPKSRLAWLTGSR